MPISNVRRLVNLIREQATVVYEQATDAWDLDTPEYRLAAFLASHGVLAVDDISDEQAMTVLDGRRHGDQCGGDLAVCEHLRVESLRAALRRCATGEAE